MFLNFQYLLYKLLEGFDVKTVSSSCKNELFKCLYVEADNITYDTNSQKSTQPSTAQFMQRGEVIMQYAHNLHRFTLIYHGGTCKQWLIAMTLNANGKSQYGGSIWRLSKN